jgi:predicted ATPase
MIKAVLFDAYRSIKGPARIDFSKITVLCGPNSAGKSCLLRALNFFSALASTDPFSADKKGGPVKVLDSGRIHESQLRIGIEFEINKYISNEKRKIAYTNNYISAGWDHQYFWDDATGKVIKLIVQCGGDDPGFSDLLELYIDNELVLQIDNNPTYFDNYFNPIDTADVDNLDTPVIYGRLKIHDSLYFTYLPVTEERSDTPLKKLFRSRDGEWSTIRGLDFSYLITQDTYKSTIHLINPHGLLTDWFEDEENFITLFKSKINTDSIKPNAEEEYRKWLSENLDEDLTKDARKIYNSLWDEADQFKCFMEGIFIQLEDSLNFQQVSGARGIVNSQTPYHLGSRFTMVGEHTFPDQNEQIKQYLNKWWKKNTQVNKEFEVNAEEKSQEDLVNIGFSMLMPSLGGFRLALQTFVLRNADPKNGEQKLFESHPIYHKLSNGALVYPYLKSNATNSHLLDFREVGSGLSFMFPILASLETNLLSIIEQPELHLHPRAQCELGDVFIYASHKGSNSVIETHSEHLILRLSRRIRETTKEVLIKNELKLKPENVNIHYFKPNGDGTTSIHKIRFDHQGEFLDLWPDGFFAERDSELFDE